MIFGYRQPNRPCPVHALRVGPGVELAMPTQLLCNWVDVYVSDLLRLLTSGWADHAVLSQWNGQRRCFHFYTFSRLDQILHLCQWSQIKRPWACLLCCVKRSWWEREREIGREGRRERERERERRTDRDRQKQRGENVYWLTTEEEHSSSKRLEENIPELFSVLC